MDKIFKDKQHPEKQEDEVFLTNVSTHSTWLMIPWKTKRQGQYALDEYGRIIPRKGTSPIFVKKAELQQAGYTIKLIPYLQYVPSAEDKEQISNMMQKDKNA